MVRPGISLYGYHLPFERAGGGASESAPQLALKPVLAWKTRILSLREVAGGQPLGYGGTYVTKAPARIAVLPVGYADGLNRQISSRGRVIVRDTYSQIVGRISMDLTLVDVTAVRDVCVGDEVVLLGASGGLSIDAHEHAKLANTIAYEILCNISKRVPRHYTE
jgi:alanine racemase